MRCARAHRVKISPKKIDVKKKFLNLNEIPIPKNSIISKLHTPLKNTLLYPLDKIVLPPDTDLEIIIDDSNQIKKSIIQLKHSAFNIEIKMSVSRWNTGLPWGYPLRYKYQRIDKNFDETKRFMDNIATVTLDAEYKAIFDFPNVKDPMFKEYHYFATTLFELMKDNWDWDNFIEKLPHGKLYSIEDKIDEILTIISNAKT